MRVDNPGPPVTPPGLAKTGGNTQETGNIKPNNGVESNGETKVPGVIRLLQEGHFKGVADVRLRINFHDQLQGIAGASQSLALEPGGASVVSAVEEAVNALLASDDLTDEQRTEIQNLLDKFIDNVDQISADNGDDFFANIKSAFAEFSTGLREFLGVGLELAPAEETTPVEGVDAGAAVGEEPSETPGLSIEELVAAIESAFSEAIAALQEAVAQAGSILPESSEPNGNGVAYQKFVDILEGLQEDIPVEPVGEGEGSGGESPDTNSIDENI
jgi:hypothetical protein